MGKYKILMAVLVLPFLMVVVNSWLASREKDDKGGP